MKRRNFVKTLASLAAVGSVSSVASAAGFGGEPAAHKPQGPAAGTPRGFTAAHFSLQLNGTDVGFVHSVEGGNAVADVVLENTPGTFASKRLGTIKYEPLRIKLPMVAHAAVTKAINDGLASGGIVKSLAIVGMDMSFKITSFREATDCVLTEVGFEQLDATSKAPLNMVLGFQPTVVRTIDKAGEANKAAVSGKTKAVLESNFRLTIDGVDATGVTSIKPILAKRSSNSATIGSAKTSMQVGGRFVADDIELEVGSQHAQPFVEWFEEFAINRSKPEERTAKLELLGPDLKAVLYTVTLSGVGISALRVGQQEAQTDKLARMKASIYFERFSFA
jgi:hypothetical protein